MKNSEIIKQMTLEEKAGLCSGADFWHTKAIKRLGVPAIMLTDGPHGLRKQEGTGDHLGLGKSVPATCFPTGVAVASSWDTKLIEQMGRAIGEEAAFENVGVVLGPSINIKRSPLCGRNFEYLSEDPYLTGKLAAAYIKGLQANGVGASVKHFAANNQEMRRMTINTIVDERAMREIYLTAFEIAVKEARPWTVMSAYNKLNGTYCNENTWLMKILRNEWGHQGLVVTDWGAENERIDGLLAGNELEMPSCQGQSDAKIVAAVKAGILDEQVLDKCVDRLLTLVFKVKANRKTDKTYSKEAHHALACQIAEQSMVLLKNEDEFLPLTSNLKIAVIGDMAKHPRYQGAGSSVINPTQLKNAYDAIKALSAEISWAQGYHRKTEIVDEWLVQEACDIARAADVVLVFVGLTEIFESEGFDRTSLCLPQNQNVLVSEISKVNKNIVVVLSGGAPVEMPWLHEVKGLLNAYLGGQGGGTAVANLLFGKVNPSGKLAETYPLCLEDTPCYNNYPGSEQCVEYRESIYVGYRYYDTAKKSVLFPFGYGLSYTRFSYSDLTIEKRKIVDTETVKVCFKVKNAGAYDGAEIAQLYVSAVKSSIFKAQKELKGFKKVFLKVGEEKKITITLDKRSFAYYDIRCKDWQVESGDYKILVGASSRDIRLDSMITVTSSTDWVPPAEDREAAVSYTNADIVNVSDKEFSVLLGCETAAAMDEGKVFTANSTIEQARDTFVGKIIYNYVQNNIIKKGIQEADTNKVMNAQVTLQMPLRAFGRMSGGIMNEQMVDGFVMILNGKLCKGIWRLLKGAIHRKHV
ncbi:Thermostable beta-glucosidase B [Propionispora sp. 2/2-37]|uniref:beta-glucosidase n=1 Tax=Propionispora sp. 2/2-37 TaxID=1677858 RepID=UPI0006BB5A25|nr:glycoside hydrolase family 3 C-terminal domain-containing protein [Propionispora sp. 2/2-37]CUH97029.1 Thermostable beta-glucosidase B [Propionispora sp. 2/2-37]